VAVSASVVMAAVVNVATGMLTEYWSVTAWVCTVVALAAGVALALWQTTLDAPPAPRSQEVHNSQIGGSGRQLMNGPGEQVVRDSTIGNDVTQRQEG
jgi:hypothetical protein